MPGLRKTEDYYSIKTRLINVQNTDGTFPPPNSVLTVKDELGHTAWSQDLSLNAVSLVGPSGEIVLTTDGTQLLVDGSPVGGGTTVGPYDGGFIPTTTLAQMTISFDTLVNCLVTLSCNITIITAGAATDILTLDTNPPLMLAGDQRISAFGSGGFKSGDIYNLVSVRTFSNTNTADFVLTSLEGTTFEVTYWYTYVKFN
jgi:hypothetical protein